MVHISPVAGPSVDGIAVYKSEVKDGEVFALVPSDIATGPAESWEGSPSGHPWFD